jgi:hypothetical protein
MIMRLRVWVGILLVSAWAATEANAQAGHSVNDLVALVRTAIANQQSDRNLAKALHKFKLTESLDQRTIEGLENEGAGPQAVAELERLRQASAVLPKAPAAPMFEARPAPAPDEQKRIVEAARQSALDYTRSLPDFICTQVVRRYVVRRYGDPRGKLVDTLTLQLSYSGQRENYKLLTINGRPTFRPFDSVGGVITQGEFASLLSEVFERRSEAEFQWDHWTTLRKRPAQVYTFRVSAGKSHYRMAAVGRSERYSAAVGQHGLLYVDRDTNRTIRIVAEADGIPPDFPVHSATTTLDYDFVDIAGRQFLLPLSAGTRMTTVDRETRNEVEFHSYRKFGADTTITYDPR